MLSAPPQDTSEDEESRVRLSKEELRERLQGREMVQDSIIQGDDLIAILHERTVDPTVEITIKNSVIEGGLDFTALPATPVEQVKWPRLGSDEDRERWIERKRSSGIDKIYVVANPITIVTSTVLPRPQNGQSDASVAINGNAAFFHDITFEGATFSGGVLFEGATFSREAGFQGATFSRRVTFEGATFSGGARFEGATFSWGGGFQEATFSQRATFEGATFSEEAVFRGATFSEEAVFQRATFSQWTGFQEATFSRGATFEGATFSEEAVFQRATFSRGAGFERATFEWAGFQEATFSGERDAAFRGATFSRGAGFERATFEWAAGFWDATFSGEARFEGATFKKWAWFMRATFKERASFQGAIFEWTALFGNATFKEGATFQGATFSQRALFEGTTFSGEAGFQGATFSREAVFKDTRFAKLAFFKDAHFLERLTLERSLFETYADFRDAQINWLAFNNATSPLIINGRMDFRRATITEADLQDLVFTKDINFSDTWFGVAVEAKGAPQRERHTARHSGPRAEHPQCPRVTPDVATVLRFVTFEGHAYFLRTAFCGRTSLERVIFHRDANFTDATFQDHQASGRPGFSLSYVNFTTLRLKWSQLTHPASWVKNSRGDQKLEPLSEVLKSLEANFRRQNELEDANEAYYQMKRAELQETRERSSFRQRLSREIEWLFFGILCGYGTGFWTIVSWTLGFNVVFTLIYWTMGDLQRHRNPDITRDFTFKQRLLDFPHLYITSQESSKPYHATPAERLMQKAPTRDAARKFWDALRFSSGILFKMGYRDTTVSGHIGKWDLRWIVAVEWLLGFYLLALLIYTLTNTQPLLNRLIQGVF